MWMIPKKGAASSEHLLNKRRFQWVHQSVELCSPLAFGLVLVVFASLLELRFFGTFSFFTPKYFTLYLE